MAQVDIVINGRIYGVACDTGQEPRVRELAEMVDSRVRELTGPGAPQVSEAHILVLAGLMLADELIEVRAEFAERESAAAADPEDDQELLVAAVDHLTERIGVIANRLGRA